MPGPQPLHAETFQQLHRHGLLHLANAWDAGSARLIESLGAPALATTSAGVAWAHGYPDGDALPLEALVATVREITRVVRVPLSVDMEGGYADDPAQVGENVAAVLEAGGVGINLEDSNAAPERLCAKIAAARRAAERAGVNLYINARADLFLRNSAATPDQLKEALRRARLYREAGASGFFAPGLVEAEGIRALAAGQPLPLNVMARRHLPVAADLIASGARRLSAGSGISESVFRLTRDLAAGFLATGDSAPLVAQTMTYPQINALMTPAAAVSCDA